MCNTCVLQHVRDNCAANFSEKCAANFQPKIANAEQAESLSWHIKLLPVSLTSASYAVTVYHKMLGISMFPKDMVLNMQ